jgi:hypothetical protein
MLFINALIAITIEPSRGQVILSPEHKSFLFSDRAEKMRFPAYFAGYYKTPPELLEAMASGALARDFRIAQALAVNVGAPVRALTLLKTNVTAVSLTKEIQATLSVPHNVKDFLTSFE